VAEAIVYCDACGKMIPPSELARGGGYVSGATALCATCLGKLSPEQRAQLELARGQGAAAAGQVPARRTPRPTERAKATAPPARSPRVVLVFAGLAAGLLVGGAVAVVVTSPPRERVPQPVPVGSEGLVPGGASPLPSREEERRAAGSDELAGRMPRPVAVERPAPAEERESAAASRLREIRTLMDRSLSRYAELRPLLQAALQEFRSAPEAEEFRKVLSEVEGLVEQEVSAASSRAAELIDSGKFDEAVAVLDSVEGRFAESEWYSRRGRELVSKWRTRAKEAGEAAKAASEERAKAEAASQAWKEFVTRFLEAGSAGVGRARDLAEKERPRLTKLGLAERLDRIERRIREAGGVESLIEEGVRTARGLVRLRWKERPVSGNVVRVEGGKVTLKPILGQEIELPLAEVAPLDLVQAAGLLGAGAEADGILRVASYLLVRGELDSAAKVLADLTAPRAEELLRELRELAGVLEKGKEKRPPEENEPAPAREAQPAAQAQPIDFGEDVTNGLLAYFKFDEGRGTSVLDEPGTGAKRDSGTVQGNGTEGVHWSWVEGKFGKALSFSPDRSGGVGKEVFNHVGLADGEIRWIHKGSHSLACWVKFPEGPPRHGGGLVKAAGYNVGLGCRSDAKGYYFSFGQTFDNDNKIVTADDREPRQGGAWLHVAGTCDVEARKMSLYVNGVLVDQKDFPTPGQSLTGGPNGWNVGANQPGTWWNDPCAAAIDEVRFYNRALTKEEVAEIYSRADREIAIVARSSEERRLLMAEAFGKPDAEGYLLDVRAIARLAAAHKKDRVVQKKLADVGGATAASPSFGAAVRKELRAADGYSFAPATGLASSGLTLAEARKSLARPLERERPELVRFCFDATDLARSRPIAEIKADLAEIVEKTLERGSAAVLCTLPIREPQDEKAKKLVQEYNSMVMETASRLHVPCLDVYGILNSEGAGQKGYFTPAGAVSQAGFDAVNARYLRLYRVLERWVMGRRSAPAAAEPPREAPKANPVPNGGFEQLGDDRFARDWKAHDWGPPGSQSVVKSDASNPRTGERCIVAQGTSDAARPGAFTSVKLAQGKYELRFWACAEVGKKAQVAAHVAGKDFAPKTVGEDWEMISFQFEQGEDPRPAGLKLWVVTPRAKVWFDDVEILPAARQ